MQRTYENALSILVKRARGTRPNSPSSSTLPLGLLPGGNPTFKGRPPIENMREWLRQLGHSDDVINSLNIIHVAGTKGKGSTCAYIESFLRQHGKRTGFPRKTGLYTSPHLIDINERIRIDFEPLSNNLFALYFFEVYDTLIRDASGPSPMHRQLLTLVSLHAFIKEGVDVAIYETHLGGEYDTTNVIAQPVITVITPIGKDHLEQLGPTVETIAWHKAGIFKRGALAYSAPQTPQVADILEARAEEKGVQALEFVDFDKTCPGYPLWTDAQRTNCSLARNVSDAFLGRKNYKLDEEDIKKAISQFQWPGRFQTVVKDNTTWFLDGAHNVLSVPVAADWFSRVSIDKAAGDENITRILIFSQISNERDGVEVCEALAASLATGLHYVILTTYEAKKFQGDQKMLLERYHQVWNKCRPDEKVLTRSTIKDVMDLVEGLDHPKKHVLVTGSLHLVGSALELLNPRNSAHTRE